jgi:hypothetical protein
MRAEITYLGRISQNEPELWWEREGGEGREGGGGRDSTLSWYMPSILE